MYMFSKIVYTSILSIVTLMLLHHIYSYLKKNLTIPRVHDMVSKPEKKYQEIYNKLQSVEQPIKPPEKTPDMTHELKDYIRNLTTNVSVPGDTTNTSPYTVL